MGHPGFLSHSRILYPTRIVIASKSDVANPDKLKKLQAMARRKKLPFYAISAVTGAGIEALKFAVAERVRALREPIAEAG